MIANRLLLVALLWVGVGGKNHWSNILTRAKKDLERELNGGGGGGGTGSSAPFGEGNVEQRRSVTDAEIAALVEEGNRQLAANDINGVINTFFSVLDADPTRHDVNAAMGQILSSVQQYDLAQGFLFAAVQLSNWTYAPAVASLADTLRLDNEPALAEQVAAKGLTVVTEADGKALLQAAMGQICAVRGEWEKSADWFLAAALTQPALVDNWLKASTILFPAQHQNMTFAANVLSEAMRMHPNDGRLLYHSALVLHNTGRVAEAVRHHAMTLLAPLPLPSSRSPRPY